MSCCIIIKKCFLYAVKKKKNYRSTDFFLPHMFVVFFISLVRAVCVHSPFSFNISSRLFSSMMTMTLDGTSEKSQLSSDSLKTHASSAHEKTRQIYLESQERKSEVKMMKNCAIRQKVHLLQSALHSDACMQRCRLSDRYILERFSDLSSTRKPRTHRHIGIVNQT